MANNSWRLWAGLTALFLCSILYALQPSQSLERHAGGISTTTSTTTITTKIFDDLSHGGQFDGPLHELRSFEDAADELVRMKAVSADSRSSGATFIIAVRDNVFKKQNLQRIRKLYEHKNAHVRLATGALDQMLVMRKATVALIWPKDAKDNISKDSQNIRGVSGNKNNKNSGGESFVVNVEFGALDDKRLIVSLSHKLHSLKRPNRVESCLANRGTEHARSEAQIRIANKMENLIISKKQAEVGGEAEEMGGRVNGAISMQGLIQIDRRSDLTPESYRTEYFQWGIPVVITGAMTNWPAMRDSIFTVANLPTHVQEMRRSAEEIRASYGMPLRHPESNAYVVDKWEMPHVLDGYPWRGISPPFFFVEKGIDKNSAAGTRPHLDATCGTTMSAQFQGVKRWKLVPTSRDVGVSKKQDVGPSIPVPESVAKKLPGFTTDVRPGEILMFPLGYWHSTQVLEAPMVSMSIYWNGAIGRNWADGLWDSLVSVPKYKACPAKWEEWLC